MARAVATPQGKQPICQVSEAAAAGRAADEFEETEVVLQPLGLAAPATWHSEEPAVIPMREFSATSAKGNWRLLCHTGPRVHVTLPRPQRQGR